MQEKNRTYTTQNAWQALTTCMVAEKKKKRLGREDSLERKRAQKF